VHIHVCFFLEVFTDSVTVDVFFHTTSTFFSVRMNVQVFFCEECADLF